jgi:hypothetical protein
VPFDLNFLIDYPLAILEAFFALPLIGDLWWLWSFILFSYLAKEFWLIYKQEYWRRTEIKWVTLELKISREHKKSPKAMEQVFMSIHGIKNNPSSWKEKWIDGEITMWFSAEIVSFGGEVHFYMIIPDKHRNLVEASLYAHYNDIEITEVEDYINRFPPTMDDLKSAGYELFGNELILAKPDAYPIRSYVDFEAIEEEKTVDPISALLETIAKIKPQETIGVQILFRPKVDDSWKIEGEKLVAVLKEKSKTEVAGPTGQITWVERSPGELEIIKAVERNLAKPGFDVLIRYIYIAPKEIFSEGFARRGVYSAFNQYASESLNKFKNNTNAWTKVAWYYYPWFFPSRRKFARQRRIYQNYRNRWIYDDPEASPLEKYFGIDFFHFGIAARSQRMVLNTEELATIFHPPTQVVLTAPLMKRVEAKKIGPPAGLPIYGEGDEKKLPGLSEK